jgi:hypothetical protein
VVVEWQYKSGKTSTPEEGSLNICRYVCNHAVVLKVWMLPNSAVSPAEPMGMATARNPSLSFSL